MVPICRIEKVSALAQSLLLDFSFRMELDKGGSLHFAWMEGTRKREKKERRLFSVDFDFSIDPITLRKKDRDSTERERKTESSALSSFPAILNTLLSLQYCFRGVIFSDSKI